MKMDTDRQAELTRQIEALEALLTKLDSAGTLEEKEAILDAEPETQDFSARMTDKLRTAVDGMQSENRYLLKCLLAIGQGDYLLDIPEELDSHETKLRGFLDSLRGIDRSYLQLGGIVGYQYQFLKLILETELAGCRVTPNTRFLEPEGIDLSVDTDEVREATVSGIQHLDAIAEIYPIGGAGERLNLVDKASGEPLPVAKLAFGGRTLLEGLIRDVQAKEYLHYKVFGKQVRVPVAMMTSSEKNNHEHVKRICEENSWFHRSKDLFCLFTQPGVPVVDVDGNWVLEAPLELSIKPGGHGVIWQQARTQGVIDWLRNKGCRKALVRQINNPIASTDHGTLAFTGIGYRDDKAFGFASCSRLLHAPEGMDVLIERKTDTGFAYTLTNIEYTDFACYGIKDAPKDAGTAYSAFPANTNVLFVDLDTVEDLSTKFATPGLLVNIKSEITRVDKDGTTRKVAAGRMESTMQNLADYLVAKVNEPLRKGETRLLPSYLTFNERSKTISVSKRAYNPGDSLTGTPEGCFYDVLCNNRDLLVSECGVKAEQVGDTGRYMRKGPGCLFLFNPALGPLYSVIAQKIRGGLFHPDAELQLEIADVLLERLEIHGSLLIEAQQTMGHLNEDGTLQYSDQTGRCILKDVHIQNQGIDRSRKNHYWCNEVRRRETCRIVLEGTSEFYAKGVTLKGDMTITVPDGQRMEAYWEGGEVKFRSQPLDATKPLWTYRKTDQNRIELV